MDTAEELLATECFGYGSWKAPFWFIGPEQGQGSHEGNDLTPRYNAFRECNVDGLSDGLSDSKAFHALIQEHRWHRENPALQSTWRRLMILLLAYQGCLTGDPSQDDKILRDYQRDKLGMRDGKTCLIELSGIPARSFTVPRDRETHRGERLEKLQKKITNCKPEFVVIYGKGQWKHWKRFPEFGSPSENIMKIGHTLIAFALHPQARGTTDESWIQLGEALRRTRDAKS